MTSEIRANTLKNRVGLGTVSFTNTGPVVSGIVTIANSTTEGVTLEDNAGVGNSLKITTPTGYVSIGSGNSTFVHLNTDRGVFYFQKRIFVDEGIIASYDENLILQSPSNTNRVIINKDTGLVSILNDLDVDGHTNLDNVNITGVTTTTEHIDIDADNKALRIGDSQDIQIFHNTVVGGTRFANSSYIENNTGNLFIRGIVGTIIGSTAGEIYAQFLKGDKCELRYDNNVKFVTTNTGINVTGNITATGNLTPGGTLYLTDAIEHTDDSNTKIRFPADDTFTVETNNTERFRIGSNGYIGVGNFSSKSRTDPLNVDSGIGTCNIGGNYIHLSRYSGGGTNYITAPQNNANLHISADDYISIGVDHSSSIYTHNTEAIRIDSSGRVIIGGTSPVTDAQLTISADDAPAIAFQRSGSGKFESAIGMETNSALRFYTGADSSSISGLTERMQIDANGQVLIGTTTAGYGEGDDLTIATSGHTGITIRGGTSNDCNIYFADGTSGNAQHQGIIQYRHSLDALRFFTNATERLRITSNGYVQVKGNHASGLSGGLLSVNNEQSGAGISLIGTGGSWNEAGWAQISDGGLIRSSANATGGLNFQAASGDMRFYAGSTSGSPTYAAERLRIYADGNIQLLSDNGNESDTPGIIFRGGNSTQKANFAKIHSRMTSGWGGQIQFKVKNDTGSLADAYQTAMIMDHNAVIRMPNQCGFHMIHDGNQSLSSGAQITNWDTDASSGKSYIKNCSFNSGRFVAPVDGLYFFTAQLLLMQVATNDDSIHIIWSKGSSNTSFSYWNTRHDGSSAHGSYGYGSYLPVTGSTTAYLSAGEIFGIKASFSGAIAVYGTDSNWGHWSGYLVG